MIVWFIGLASERIYFLAYGVGFLVEEIKIEIRYILLKWDWNVTKTICMIQKILQYPPPTEKKQRVSTKKETISSITDISSPGRMSGKLSKSVLVRLQKMFKLT